MPTKKSSVILSIMIFIGTLSLGFSSVAQAELKWVETIRTFCPEVCQNTNYKFAVPSGINPKATKARGSESVYYVCATIYSGWRIGYHINYQHNRCYVGFRGGETYGEHYLCLCTNQEIPLLGNSTGYIKRK